MLLRVVCLLSLLCLAGCATTNQGPIKLFPEGARTAAEIVTLHPLSSFEIGSMVLRIDGQTPTSCMWNCMFVKPVEIAPGMHKFASYVLNVPPSNTPPLAPSELPKNAHPLIYAMDKSGLFNAAFTFEFDEELAPGKEYRLMIGRKSSVGEWRGQMVVWWQEIGTN